MKRGDLYSGLGVLIIYNMISSCSYYQNPPPPSPPKSDETSELEAEYIAFPPASINAPYWRTSDFIKIIPEEITKGRVINENGLLNMNSMYEGIADFNSGDSSFLTLKAAYDDDNLYILAEWLDQTFNVSQASWFYNGPPDVHKPLEDTAGWTSQLNDDKLILSFITSNNTKDIWKWSLSVSEPLGYAIDMFDDGNGEMIDEGDMLVKRNIKGSDNRSGPAYEWNGDQQDITRPLAQVTVLDPAFYLLNKTEFTGDIVQGDNLYQKQCAGCHGDDGDGSGPEWGNTFVPFTDPTFNRFDRNAFDQIVSNSQHTGNSRWTKLSATEKDDLTARIRGFAGVPGYYIDDAQTSFPDVQSISNVNIARVDYFTKDKNSYKVLLIRPLITGKSDDIQFELNEKREYTFHVYLTDNDDLNRVGKQNKILIFK